MKIGIESGTIFFTLGGLFFFGVLYARLINWLHKRSYNEGYTAILVVGGVLATVLTSTIIHHQDPLIDLLLELACFAASGLPMVVNDLSQYMLARESERQLIVNQEYRSDETETTL